MNHRTVRVCTVISLALVLSACSADERGADSTSSTTRSTTTSTATTASATSTTSTSEPAGTDAAAVKPVLQALVDRYDIAVAAILADPRVAADSEDQAVVAYLDLFAPGSTFAAGALGFWTQEGERGRFYRAGPRGELTRSTVMDVTASSADEVTFTICAVNSIEIVDASGSAIESQGGQTAASVVAVRLDGAWLLRDLTQASATGCPEPGPVE